MANDGVYISGGNITAGNLAIGHRAKAITQATAPTAEPAAVTLTQSIFLSYRRKDSKAYAGRLRDALRPCLHPPAELFMDLDSIAGGDDFADVIDQALATTEIVLVLIGPSWLTLPGLDGQTRLLNPQDLVRHEVQCALELNRKVIPLLVDGASMPKESELPQPLAPLARRNALELSDTRWDYDLNKLLATLAR